MCVQSKLHVVKEATDRFVRQGMPVILMSRIKAITALNMNGRTDLELELEVERQKAAECLYFLYYQVRLSPLCLGHRNGCLSIKCHDS